MPDSSQTKVRAKGLRKKTEKDLLAELEVYKRELASLRVGQVATAPQASTGKIKIIRHAIATTMLVYHEKRRQAAKDQYKGKKYVPLDLRPRFTKKIRQQLSKKQATKVTLRARKRALNFPRRKYALLV